MYLTRHKGIQCFSLYTSTPQQYRASLCVSSKHSSITVHACVHINFEFIKPKMDKDSDHLYDI